MKAKNYNIIILIDNRITFIRWILTKFQIMLMENSRIPAFIVNIVCVLAVFIQLTFILRKLSQRKVPNIVRIDVGQMTWSGEELTWDEGMEVSY